MTATSADGVGPLLASLRDGFDALPADLRHAGTLGDARRNALDALLADGLPGARAERWKYTSLRAFQRRAFAPAGQPPAIDRSALDTIPAPRLVFVNGQFDAALSALSELPEGVSLRPLSEALAENEPRAVNHLARQFSAADEVFARANAALAVEGVLLRVAADQRALAPVHLVFVGATASGDQAWHLRHLIELREGATLTVVEHHLADGAHRHLANTVTQVHLKPGATLIHARIQDEADGASLMARTDAVLASDAEYRRLDLELGAGLSRHELNVALQGERARLTANGVLMSSGKRHLDTRLSVDHVAGDTACELIWRGLAADTGRAAFHGGILIRAGADGSSAELSNKNLLLSEGAEIDTQPVLEIHADEVKAAHGATVGQLNDAALFYLRSRGIPEAQARTLLTGAFCREALAAMPDEGLAETLSLRLDAALARLGDRA